MKVSGLTRAGNEVRFDVVGAHSSYSTWFRFAGPYELDLSGSPALTAGLIPALVARESLHVAGPVDTKLLENAAAAQDVLCAWEYDRHPRYPRFSPVPVNTGNPAAQRSGGDADEGGVACFFSGGLDSFYSVVKHRDELSALVFAIGFDIMLDDTALVEVVLPELRAAAATIGLPLIEVTTNLRGLGEHFGCSWGMDYHGAALGTIANLLSPQFSKVLIPSSRTYARLEPWGSHVLVDPLWSTSRMTVAHDGAEATRVEKCRAIADDDAAHQFLRVCHHNYGLGVYNCGRCEKCVSTAASALAAGVGDRFGTLPQPPLSAVLTTEFDVGPACHWRETRAELRRSGHRRLLRYAIDAALLRNRLARPFRRAKARITWAATHPRDLYRRIRKTPP